MKSNVFSYNPARSKSITNRALVLAALFGGKSFIQSAPYGDDVNAMIEALRKLGIEIDVQEKEDSRDIVVNKKIDLKEKYSNKVIRINAKNAGTTSRFILAYAATLNKKIILSGSAGLKKRPIAELVDALNQLGAHITYEEEAGHLPVCIHPQVPQGGTINISMQKTSQYASALSLIAPFLQKKTTIKTTGDRRSKSYFDTTRTLIKLWSKDNVQKNRSKKITIPVDIASASYIIAISVINCTKILVRNMILSDLDAEKEFFKYIKKMGCDVGQTKTGLLISPPRKFKPLKKIDAREIPDSVLTLAMICALTQDKTTISNVSHLRYKECDRLLAMSNELKKLGAKVQLKNNTITIGRGEKVDVEARINTYDDHRMAMVFSIPKSIYPSISIENPVVVQKSYTKYWEDYRKTILSLNKNFILVGMPGSGKTSLAKELARLWDYSFIDLDETFVTKEKMSIETYIQKHGWESFRKKESKILKTFKPNQRIIISTGGGAILKKENISVLKKLGIIIYLETGASQLTTHLKKDSKNSRPHLQKDILDKLKTIEKERIPLYKAIKDISLSPISETKNKEYDIKRKIKNLENQLFYCHENDSYRIGCNHYWLRNKWPYDGPHPLGKEKNPPSDKKETRRKCHKTRTRRNGCC
ncbi:MAG: 3-phosphoshikimate 1-carboxyvinyltransferase [Candidatus Gracilibacteria bacterium]